MLLRLVLLSIGGAFASFVRVETGHRKIEIEGRLCPYSCVTHHSGDAYYGHFTKVLFAEPTCIRAVSVHCLVPLTGAEEIDLLYSQCKSGPWRVAHYNNKEERFYLKDQIYAQQLSVTSRQPLAVVDLQVEPCLFSQPPNITCASSHRRRRRHRTATPLRVRERKRRKREISTRVFALESSPHHITDNITVESGSQVFIEGGARLRFEPNTGSLTVNGSRAASVVLEKAGQQAWLGVVVSSADQQSVFSYVNISGSRLGLTVRESATFPQIDHVIADGNDIGFDLDVQKTVASTSSPLRVSKASAVHSAGSGFRLSGQAPMLLDGCLAASNREHGFVIDGSSSIAFLSSHSFSNSEDGFLIRSTANVNLANSLIETGKINLSLLGVNITGHIYNPAVRIDNCENVEAFFNACHIYDNHDGAIVSDGRNDGCEIKVHGANFTRNRGPTVQVGALTRGTVLLEANSFTANHLNVRADREALVNVEAGHDSTVVIADNVFYKNTMESVVKLAQFGATPTTVVARNHFFANLAFNVIFVDVTAANVSHNFFNNQQVLSSLFFYFVIGQL